MGLRSSEHGVARRRFGAGNGRLRPREEIDVQRARHLEHVGRAGEEQLERVTDEPPQSSRGLKRSMSTKAPSGPMPICIDSRVLFSRTPHSSMPSWPSGLF